ncbi:hypothetical protein Tco_0238503 [Tanacetum coccineum]
MRTRRLNQRTGRRSHDNGSDTGRFDKSKESKSSKRTVNEEDTSSKELLAIDVLALTKDNGRKQCDDLIVKLNDTKFKAVTYKRGLATVEDQLVTFRKNEVFFSKEIVVLKREVVCKEYEIGVLKSEFEKVKQEKEGYHVVPPPHPLSLNVPTKLDLSYSDNSKENTNDTLEKEQVSDSEYSSVEFSPNVVKEIVFHTAKKVEFVKPKNNEKPVKKTVRYMTGNITYLSNFKEFDGGHVTFGGGAYGGRISGKGTLKTDSLDFDDVYFVELNFNLFSVSQMCDKRNYVLFTDTECLVLSPNFKFPDESQILLKIPREDNMYSFDMKNIVPKDSLTCLAIKAHCFISFDSSSKDVGNDEPKSVADDPKHVEDGPSNEDDDKDKFEDDSSPKEVNADEQQVNITSPGVNTVPATPNTRIHQHHPLTNVIEELKCVNLQRIEDPNYPDKFYKVVKALYGLHQAPRAWSYVIGFEKLKKDKFQMSSDERHYLLSWINKSMIGSLMYLTASRPDIMFVVCAYARFQVTPKTSHLLAVKRIFRYLKGKPTLGLWYSTNSPFELCKKQTVVDTFTTETEYVAATSCCGQVKHIEYLMLNASPLKHVKRGRDTKIPQFSGPLVKVGDEAVHKKLGDIMERAATTASSLEAKQDSGNINKTQSMATLNGSSP